MTLWQPIICESKELHLHINKHDEDDSLPEHKPTLSLTLEGPDMREDNRPVNADVAVECLNE